MADGIERVDVRRDVPERRAEIALVIVHPDGDPVLFRQRGQAGQIASHRRRFRPDVLQRVLPVANLDQADPGLAGCLEDRPGCGLVG